MAWYEVLAFSFLFVYIAVNIICVGFLFSSGLDVEDTVIDQICEETDMNIFGKILCSVLVFLLLPLIHIICFGYRFIYWITHVKVRKEKNK